METTELTIPVLEHLLLSDICLSVLNPRKTHDQDKLADLAGSIRSIGVIQAVTVRPLAPDAANKHQAQYELICGERRYLAADMAGLKTIPASIRELTDEQALEIMFTENIQRVDVHPLEEADAFKMAIDQMNYAMADIAAKIGKNESFVVRRLQLINLVPELKTVFRNDELSIGHAELLSRVGEQDQLQWLNGPFSNNYNGGQGTIRSLRNWLTSNTENQLSRANFKPDKPFEGKQFVSARCTVCPQNSAFNNTLFPDTADLAVCHNSRCFEAKTEAAFQVLLKKALDNPELVLINESYGESKLEDQLKKDGFTVLKGYGEYSKLSKPKKSKRFMNETDEETEARFQKDQEEYQRQNEIAVKAFNIAGSDRGCIYTIVPKSKNAAAATATPTSARVMLLNDIKQKRERGLELDAEKIMKRQIETIKALPFLKEPDEEIEAITEVESHALLCIAWEKCGHECQTLVGKRLGIKETYGYHSVPGLLKDAPNYLKAFVIKNAAFHAFNSINPKYINGPVIESLAAHWNYGEFDKINLDQGGVRKRREDKLDQKLKEFDKQNGK